MMKSYIKVTWAALFALVLQPVLAQQETTLYIPGIEPQPITVGVLGAGSDGRTTYQVEVANGVDDGVLTFTLAEGPSDVAYTAVLTAIDATATEIETIQFSCAISNGRSSCAEDIVVVADGSTSSTNTVQTEDAAGLTVQLVSVTPPAGSTTSTPTSSKFSTISTTNTASSSKSSSAGSETGSATGTNTTPAGVTPPAAATKNNAASVHSVTGSLLALMAGVSTFGYLLL
ncbi:hypothetical protein M422DRAFT_784421 [Sphaerobolus stellatus SS14]|uniref:GPI anchored protein n=1 Tax=Sphaerobolus stellatus (strain SS14) TaxID=990650 RepID=A0A0C9UUS3_SPHS4|nr:hypothetical protein M422DRAFT_71928 [Sphaerobolus stellatus SS14]KIJ29076.1 hypothetical protein M422DRAFT_784421 [Sphaerobolus stellatus SS14]